MATINSLEDFLQALDDNPSWREAVRLRILGEELLQLPARFNAFAERQQEFNERVAGFIEEQQRVNERQREVNERIEGTLEELLRLNTNAVSRMNRMESDISAVKGGHVRSRVNELLYDLIEGMNLELAHILERSELTLMSRRIPVATADERDSFRRADIVMLAGDRANGAPVYLAIEASWTGSKNDTDRVERNARFLTEATGIPAIPVIASVRNTHEVTGLIESGAVRWYRVEERDLQAE